MQRIAKFFARYDAADMSLLTYSRPQSYNKVLKLTNNWKGNVHFIARPKQNLRPTRVSFSAISESRCPRVALKEFAESAE